MAIRYRKFEPAEYVMVVRGGRVVREGPGLAVLYSTKRTSLLAVPATVLDGDFVFDDILTADFQSCCVQGTVAYRFREFRQAAMYQSLILTDFQVSIAFPPRFCQSTAAPSSSPRFWKNSSSS